MSVPGAGEAPAARPLRVLFVSHDGALAGGERSLLDLVTHLGPGFRPTVVVPPRSPLLDALRAERVETVERRVPHWVPYASQAGARHLAKLVLRAPGRVRSLAREVEEREVDVVCTSTVTPIDGALAAARAGRPHVWHLRERFDRNPDLRAYLPPRTVARVIAALSARVVVPSRALLAAFPPRVARGRVVVIPNGVPPLPPGDPAAVRAELARDHGLSAATALVGFVGGLRPVKDLPTLLRAFAPLVAQGLDVALVVVGDESPSPEHARACRALAGSLGVAGRVVFLGPRERLGEVLGCLRALVVSSRSEGFGRVAIEAMAAGLPVVATRCGGPEDVVVDGETGFLVEVGDHAAIADRLARLVRDPRLAARLGAAGARREAERFRFDGTVRAMQAVLAAAAGAAVPHARRSARSNTVASSEP